MKSQLFVLNFYSSSVSLDCSHVICISLFLLKIPDKLSISFVIVHQDIVGVAALKSWLAVFGTKCSMFCTVGELIRQSQNPFLMFFQICVHILNMFLLHFMVDLVRTSC